MRQLRHLVAVLLVGVLMGGVGSRPQLPSSEPPVIHVAQPPQGSKSGDGRVAGAAKNNGSVAGQQQNNASVGGK